MSEIDCPVYSGDMYPFCFYIGVIEEEAKYLAGGQACSANYSGLIICVVSVFSLRKYHYIYGWSHPDVL